MRTVSPARTAARPTSIRHAVWYTSGNAAAAANDKPAGIGKTLARRNDDELRERARDVLAHDAEGHAHALLARAAELADAAGEARLHQDAVARGQAPHALPERVHDTRPVAARNLRQRHVRNPVAHEDVEVVERGGADRHAHLARRRHRCRPFAVFEDFVAAVTGEEDRLHFRYPNDLSFSRYSRSLSGGAAAAGTTRSPYVGTVASPSSPERRGRRRAPRGGRERPERRTAPGSTAPRPRRQADRRRVRAGEARSKTTIRDSAAGVPGWLSAARTIRISSPRAARRARSSRKSRRAAPRVARTVGSSRSMSQPGRYRAWTP